jgi:hypothetical protein
MCSGQIWVFGERFLTSENPIKIYNLESIGKLILVLRVAALGADFYEQITPLNRQIPANLRN